MQVVNIIGMLDLIHYLQQESADRAGVLTKMQAYRWAVNTVLSDSQYPVSVGNYILDPPISLAFSRSFRISLRMSKLYEKTAQKKQQKNSV